MIVYVLFIHKKSVSKRKVCIIFIKNTKKNKKKHFSGFFKVVFWGFLGGFFIANPGRHIFLREYRLEFIFFIKLTTKIAR
jgi:hypothetical protein